MPRKARRKSISGYMHVIVRGIGKQVLFEVNSDYVFYLKRLEKYCLETEVRICAYCLMENHVHLLVRGEPDSIALLMKKIGVCYSGYFNRKYSRVGHLFQDRYLSEPVESERYLLNVFRYILRNPEKAGICKAPQYKWSSYGYYGMCPAFMEIDAVRRLLRSWQQYEQFVATDNDDQCLEYETAKHDDAWAIEKIRECLGVSSGTELQKLDKASRDKALKELSGVGLSMRQIERLTGISRGVIKRATSGDGSNRHIA